MFNQFIILIGLPGAGKTTVGHALANKLEKSFIDLDHQIEKYYKDRNDAWLTCRKIMMQHGEIYFRQLETLVLKQCLLQKDKVLALGGGAVLQANNQHLLQRHYVVYLKIDKLNFAKRLRQKGIPAYFNQQKTFQENIEDIWRQREALYQSLANSIVENNKGVDITVNELLKQVWQ